MKISSEVFNKFSDFEFEEVAPGMKRKIMGYDEKIMLVYVQFDKGAIGVVHKHYHSQTSYVLSGKFEVSIGEKKEVLGTNDVFYAPPNVDHGAVCMEAGVLIDVFSPVREDFLSGESGYTK